LTADLRTIAREDLELQLCLSWWRYDELDKFNKLLRTEIEKLRGWNKTWMNQIDILMNQALPAQAAFSKAMGQAEQMDADHRQHFAKITAYYKRDFALAKGRIAGAAKNRVTGKENQSLLKKAISDLFAKPAYPGWRWSNDEITAHLAPLFAKKYKPSSILAVVKVEAARNRKAEKARQASKLPKR
jgi:hypothetical protein